MNITGLVHQLRDPIPWTPISWCRGRGATRTPPSLQVVKSLLAQSLAGSSSEGHHTDFSVSFLFVSSVFDGVQWLTPNAVRTFYILITPRWLMPTTLGELREGTLCSDHTPSKGLSFQESTSNGDNWQLCPHSPWMRGADPFTLAGCD